MGTFENQIVLDGDLSLESFEKVVLGGYSVALGKPVYARVKACYEFLEEFRQHRVIYGINTGFGPMAQYRISDDELQALQYNLIRSHATGCGKPLEPEYVRAAMLCRLQVLSRGRSGVHIEALSVLEEFINHGFTPYVPRHGSVGASGDLVQMAHIALALLGEGELLSEGRRIPVASVSMSFPQYRYIHIREGLAMVNGTSVMCGIGLVTLLRAKRLFNWALAASALINEVAASYSDFLSPALFEARGGSGQAAVAERLRAMLEGSGCLRDRAAELYNAPSDEHFTHKVQPYYSLRCVPQVLGPVWHTIELVEEALVGELNSVSDNPLVCPELNNVVHGGNFHGDAVSLAMDQLKMVMVRVAMLAERQLNYLMHDRINGILPPFVNLGKLGVNYGLQAAQFTATSTTAECQTLGYPMYLHSIPNNNDNQDIVSMGTNSALLCAQVVENATEVMSVLHMALTQAVDALGIEERLSPTTREVYKAVRNEFPQVVEDRALYFDLEWIKAYVQEHEPGR